MAKLSDEESAMLKRLSDKKNAPDGPSVGKSINVNVDLSDPKQVAAAIKHGFLTADEADDAGDKDGDKNGDGDKEGDETPSRKGYFKA